MASIPDSDEPSGLNTQVILTSAAFSTNQQLLQRYVTLKYESWERSCPRAPMAVHRYLSRKADKSLSMPYEFYSLFGANWLGKWVSLLALYSHFIITPFAVVYVHTRIGQQVKVIHDLYATFNQHRFVISLADSATHTTHLFLTTGLLLKYFQRKKSLKKNKAMKLLMARFLRKILVVLKLKNITLRVRGVPLHLDVFLNMLSRPLSHSFLDPTTGTVFDETKGSKFPINLNRMFFTTPKPFGYQKTRKKGRVKRKIRRKLTKLNNVID